MENSDLELGSGDVHMIQLRLNHHVENEARHRNQYSSPSIFMVPSRLREVSPSSFNPRVVSIGPLHRDDVNVQAFEGRKSSYLIKLMSRIENYSKEEIWKTCMQKAYTSMKRIKSYYVWPKTTSYNDADLAEMMVIDACFILELAYQEMSDMANDYLGDKLQYRSVMFDLVLLENQIPLFFLREIYHSTILKFRCDVSLIQLIYEVLPSKIMFRTPLENKIDDDSISSAHHILSLLHQCYMPLDNKIKEVHGGSRIHSAIDLDMAGINFKPSKDPCSKDPTWMMGIEMKQHRRFPYFFGSWSYNPTLTISTLQIQDSTEFLLRNLIAYEQSLKTKMCFTSYANAMNMLVNTQEDVAKLIDSGVLVNLMGSNEEAANMINNLGKNVVAYTFYEEEWKKVNKYCNGYWPKHIARMRSTYFQSRWSIIALLAGIVLFVLQVVQTIFTIISSGRKM